MTQKDFLSALAVGAGINEIFSLKGLILSVIILSGFTFWVTESLNGTNEIYQTQEFWIAIVVFLVSIAFFIRGYGFECRGMTTDLPAMFGKVYIDISEEGITWKSEGSSISRRWTEYLKWKEGKRVILVYLEPAGYQVIPKSFFSSNELEYFKKILCSSTLTYDS